MRKDLEKKIFEIDSEKKYEEVALEIFEYQSENNKVYKEYLGYLNFKPSENLKIEDIPCLPIEFFKNKKVIVNEFVAKLPELVFKSSGTTGMIRSKHYIAQEDLYIKSFMNGFNDFFGKPDDYVILALLPSYLEAGNSSLVYMVDYLIKKTNNPNSGFYLDNYQSLKSKIENLNRESKKIILFGVSYALLDFSVFAEGFYENLIIIETGGMKGRKKELTREVLHERLKIGFGTNKIYSEYGMTELLSQAYSSSNELFKPSSTMTVLIRDINDPFTYLSKNKAGGINIIDLSNIYSCSFVETKDLGMKKNGCFNILGRYDNSDIRGCNLLIM